MKTAPIIPMPVISRLASKGHNIVPCAPHDAAWLGFFVRSFDVEVGDRVVTTTFRHSVDTEVDSDQLRNCAARYAVATACDAFDISAAARALRAKGAARGAAR